VFLFFFSSRRRHTRSKRDWSSDVCSSDLLKKISIDYAVMEKAKEVLVLRAPFQWDDVGSWNAIERMNPQDAGGNTIKATHAGLRSEERRVGKECRSGGTKEAYTEKDTNTV